MGESINERSRVVGQQLRRLVSYKLDELLPAIRHGTRYTSLNPFTSERRKKRIEPSVKEFAETLRRMGLHTDPRFMSQLCGILCEAARHPVLGVFSLLSPGEEGEASELNFQIVLAPELTSTLDLPSAYEGFGESDVRAIRDHVLADWPHNEHGLGACPCCGYHTLVDPPGSGDPCTICGWEDQGDFEDPWGPATWRFTPFSLEDLARDDTAESTTPPVTVQQARACFESCGACTEKKQRRSNKPSADQLPRYDWSKDSRPRY